MPRPAATWRNPTSAAPSSASWSGTRRRPCRRNCRRSGNGSTRQNLAIAERPPHWRMRACASWPKCIGDGGGACAERLEAAASEPRRTRHGEARRGTDGRTRRSVCKARQNYHARWPHVDARHLAGPAPACPLTGPCAHGRVRRCNGSAPPWVDLEYPRIRPAATPGSARAPPGGRAMAVGVLAVLAGNNIPNVG